MTGTNDIGGVNIRVLNENALAADARSLAAIDEDMARIWQNLGTPPLWARDPGFTTLVQIIL